jgi:succinate dehydrogenase / fumarate reductase cytochrome b subunit
MGIIVIWALAHHLFAGVRYLFLDLDLGITRTAARMSAWIVHTVTALMVLLYIGKIL